MKKTEKKKGYFTPFELILLSLSVLVIVVCFLIWDRVNYMRLFASLIGVVALIVCAKGNPLGQIFMILFCIMYGIISWRYTYYGEMLTYLLMCLPMAIFSLVSWLKNPYDGNRSEVKVNRLSGKEIVFMLLTSALVTVIFYFILRYFNTANLLFSTLSVTTSFAAAYLTLRRSPFFAFAYGLNDLVLIVLWTLAAFESVSYVSMVICFVAFLANDLYGFVSWLKMEKRQCSETKIK